jgi:hypothetical protein
MSYALNSELSRQISSSKLRQHNYVRSQKEIMNELNEREVQISTHG